MERKDLNIKAEMYPLIVSVDRMCELTEIGGHFNLIISQITVIEYCKYPNTTCDDQNMYIGTRTDRFRIPLTKILESLLNIPDETCLEILMHLV